MLVASGGGCGCESAADAGADDGWKKVEEGERR